MNQPNFLDITVLIESTLEVWTKLNLDRSKTQDTRKKEKIAVIHDIVKKLAIHEGLEQEFIDEACQFHEKYCDPAMLLDSYRTYFPQLEAHLILLRASDHIDSRLRFHS